MSNITLWAVYTTSDLTEGRTRNYVKHLCRSEATAIRLGKKGYVQGSDCPIAPVEAFEVNGKLVIALSHFRIEEPTVEDERIDILAANKCNAIAKAKEAGLTQADIDAILAVRS